MGQDELTGRTYFPPRPRDGCSITVRGDYSKCHSPIEKASDILEFAVNELWAGLYGKHI